MKKVMVCAVGFTFLVISACEKFDDRNHRVRIPDFNFPQTVVFEQNLSDYNIFNGEQHDLIPVDGVHPLELSSTLFTDYSHKQRLVKLPEGTQMTRRNDGSIDFPEGTLLAKTFFYYNDERDQGSGKRVIETRLLIKESSTWNVATYIWNQAQTDATLEVNGFDTQISWIDADGESFSTFYHVPTKNECMTCHQKKSIVVPLGPTLRNLNRAVERGGMTLNQINHLQSVAILNDFPVSQVPQITDYNNLSASLTERGRAYLEMNCAHCHNPDAWDVPAGRDFDFRYETSLNQTGISHGKEEIVEAIMDREMPFIGTTLIDEEGVSLMIAYIESL